MLKQLSYGPCSWIIALASCIVEIIIVQHTWCLVVCWIQSEMPQELLNHLPNHCLQQRRCLDNFCRTLRASPVQKGENNMLYESLACNIISIHFLRISNISWKDCRYEILPSAAQVFVLAKFLGTHASCGQPNFSISTDPSLHALLCWSIRGLRGLILYLSRLLSIELHCCFISAFENFPMDRWFEEQNEILMCDFVWPNETMWMLLLSPSVVLRQNTRKRELMNYLNEWNGDFTRLLSLSSQLWD